MKKKKKTNAPRMPFEMSDEFRTTTTVRFEYGFGFEMYCILSFCVIRTPDGYRGDHGQYMIQ